jgi:hypothetical protein
MRRGGRGEEGKMYHEVILLGASPPNKDLGASPLNSLNLAFRGGKQREHNKGRERR